MQWQPKEQPRHGIGSHADHSSVAPVIARAPRHVAGADYKIGKGKLLYQSWDTFWVVRVIGIHRDQDLVTPTHREKHRKVMRSAKS